MNFSKIKALFLGIFFPRVCLNCQKEGDWLCEDCLAILDILNFHKKYSIENIEDVYFALYYQGNLIKKIIYKFKYPPFIKEISQILAKILIIHFQLIDKKDDFSDYILVPVPLEKTRLKWRGFNQAEQIAKDLGEFLKIPLLRDCLLKTKKTFAQTELSEKERRENLKGAFFVKKPEKIQKRKILLVDDIFTTGTTLKECARVLKKAGAKEIKAVVLAKAKIGEDKIENF